MDTAASSPGGPAPQAERQARFLVARFELWLMPRLAARLPSWILPDHLTALGVAASTWTAFCYLRSNADPRWLWGASAGLVANWLGDSLDGTLARVRRIERPRYGFYLDHLIDAYTTTIIGLGLGLSPYMLLSVAFAGAIAYLMLSINVYLETYVFARFRYGYGMLGPTEARLALIALNLLAGTLSPLPFHVRGVEMTVFDVGGIAVTLAMLVLLVGRGAANLRELARDEPPNVRQR